LVGGKEIVQNKLRLLTYVHSLGYNQYEHMLIKEALTLEAGNFQEPCNEHSRIGQVIAVMSGKGGVGKSSVTALIASKLAQQGKRVGVLDADITGPSIPKLLGIHGKPESCPGGLLPVRSSDGLDVMSLNLLLEEEDQPVIWRGPLIAGAVKQFWTDVVWGDLDFLIIDLPPGTGDAPLTVLQSLPVDGLVLVSTPQDLAVMIVKKAIHMARSMDVPILGLVENMSGLTCPHCGELIEPFGPSQGAKISQELDLAYLGGLPINPKFRELCDLGQVEQYSSQAVDALIDNLQSVLKGGDSDAKR
jgi:Mrp family chromosome partitioning ATPase